MRLKINNKSIIFVHIPKTAGTSVIASLTDDPNIRISGHRIATDYSIEEWENSFCFSVIRNPYDRFISHWLYHTTNYDGLKFSKRNINIKNKNLMEYYHIVKIMSQWKYNWYSMSEFLRHKNSSKKIDFLLRFENLENDWLNLCSFLNIDKKPLLRIKQTPHDHYSLYYNEETKKIITEMYRDDLINYNYEFEQLY